MSIFTSVKVLDLTKVFSGPFATRHLADLGAEVIKVEPPGGDDSRQFPPLVENWSGYFEVLNRNKKSLVLDLKQADDLAQFYQLCQKADVVVENFTAPVKTRLKIDYSTLCQINPQLIYASIVGVSPAKNQKYYDIIAQAESGFVSLNGQDSDMKVATSIIDAMAGMKLAFVIASALYFRQKTGQGDQLTVSMKGVAFDLLEQNLIEACVTGQNPAKVGNQDSAIAPFGLFATKDGTIALAVGNQAQWLVLADFLGQNNPAFDRSQYSSNSLRIQNLDSLVADIETVFRRYQTLELIEILSQKTIPCGPINQMLDVLADQGNFQDKLLRWIEHPVAGKIAVPTGGIFFANYPQDNYQLAPSLAEPKP